MILVDEQNNEVGTMGKLAAHIEGKLHRAISVFVFNPKGELMLQKRARAKYHSGGLWSNTCCSHPVPREDSEAAACRRLQEEMGFSCNLKEVHQFIYRKEFGNGLTEHEYDQVFVGIYNGEAKINSEEAEDWTWMSIFDLRDDIKKKPEAYTYWFLLCLEEVLIKAGY